MERNSFKEYSVNTQCQKKSSNRRKVVWTIRCEPRVEQNQAHNFGILLSSNLQCSFHVNTRQIWQISDFGCLHVNIRRILAMELDMCNSNYYWIRKRKRWIQLYSQVWQPYSVTFSAILYLYLQFCYRIRYQTFVCILEDLFKQCWHVWLYKFRAAF